MAPGVSAGGTCRADASEDIRLEVKDAPTSAFDGNVRGRMSMARTAKRKIRDDGGTWKSRPRRAFHAPGNGKVCRGCARQRSFPRSAIFRALRLGFTESAFDKIANEL